MLPDAVRRLVNGFSIKPAERAVVLTVDDRGLQAAADLEAAGVEIARVVDFRQTANPVDRGAGQGRQGRAGLDRRPSRQGRSRRHVRQPAAELQAARAGGRARRVRREPRHLRPDRPAGPRRGGRRRHRRRRRAGRAEPDPRPSRRQVLRLLLRGPDDEGPEVRDRGGLRLDRALEALHDGDDGAVPGPALPHELDPRLREDDRARREHDRHDDLAAAVHADLDGPARRPAAGAPQAHVAPSPPQGHGREDDVDRRVAPAALLRPGSPAPRRSTCTGRSA